MTVKLTAPAFDLAVGADYTGPEEAWLIANGYAYVANEKATVTGTTNAVNIVTGGNLVVKVDGVTATAALATADTPAVAAGKIQTAVAAAVAGSTSAVVSSKLTISAPGSHVKPHKVEVVSGTGTVLANLGLTAGQSADTEKRNITAVLPAQDPTLAVNREEPWDDTYVFGATESALKAVVHKLYAVNPEVRVTELPAAGGTALVIEGDNFTGATGVTFGGTAGTSFSVADDNKILVTTPAKTAGTYDVVVQKVAGGNVTKTGAVKYVAP
jgi:hypothetical protein